MWYNIATFCAAKPNGIQEEKHSEPSAEKKYALDSFFEVAGRQGIAVMVKGFYEGYDREISEVFVYKK